ncbi:MAG: hypothetical protein LBC20_17160 [Planctomycetaceae bacterium]|nr:hypothetical protein [Planctomycetaceae bacterium]
MRVLLFLVTLKLLAVASTGEGVEAFRKGDYSKAAEEFADAEQKSPNDLRIIFNRGAALAASGKFDEAVQTLRKSAVAKDADIASKSLTLLGSLAVSRAKQLLAEKPEETPSEQRPSVLDQLLAAEKYYTESLLVEPSEPVRMNLEQIRAWKNKIQTEWDSFDRSQKRSDDITKRLQWFEDWEGTINNAIRQTNEIPDSPKKFQTFYETAREQNKLTEEISVLQNELQQTLQQKSADNKLSEQERQGMETIVRELERIHELTGEVGNLLYKFRGDKALGVAREAADLMNRIRLNLSPFEVIVQEAEKKQATLCNNNPANGNKQTETPDITEQIREEQLVANGMPLMVFRAKHGLQELAAGHGADQDQPEKLNAIRESMNLAVQYGPEIQTLAEESSQLLTENKSEDAFPKQNKALELLREILKPLQQNQQNQNQQQNQQQQNNQEQNQQQQNQQNQNQEQNQQQQNQQNNQQQKQDQKQQDQQEQKQDQQQQDQQDKTTQSDEQNPTESKQEQQKNDVTSQQKNEEMERVERMLRQVKRRQQEANEKREKLRTLLLQAVPVEKDW